MAEVTKTEKPKTLTIRAKDNKIHWRFGYQIPKEWTTIDNLEEYFEKSKRTEAQIIDEFKRDPNIEIKGA
jgi:hypothetical protein